MSNLHDHLAWLTTAGNGLLLQLPTPVVEYYTNLTQRESDGLENMLFLALLPFHHHCLSV